jgi:hypothetical protein
MATSGRYPPKSVRLKAAEKAEALERQRKADAEYKE